jgi:hypothetical protein
VSCRARENRLELRPAHLLDEPFDRRVSERPQHRRRAGVTDRRRNLAHRPPHEREHGEHPIPRRELAAQLVERRPRERLEHGDALFPALRPPSRPQGGKRERARGEHLHRHVGATPGEWGNRCRHRLHGRRLAHPRIRKNAPRRARDGRSLPLARPRAGPGSCRTVRDDERTGGLLNATGGWTCPQRTDTSDVGVSPRGGSPNGEAGGGERGTPAAATVVYAGVQGRGHCLGAPGRAVAAGDLSRVST